jgi:hypothetical protein
MEEEEEVQVEKEEDLCEGETEFLMASCRF